MIGVRLQRLKTEDFIWIIYFFIALAGIISDAYERNFILTNDLKSQKKFKAINIAIFIVALFIYIYFVFINYSNVQNLKQDVSKKEGLNKHLLLVASLLFLIGGVISLYVEINSESFEDNLGIE